MIATYGFPIQIEGLRRGLDGFDMCKIFLVDQGRGMEILGLNILTR